MSYEYECPLCGKIRDSPGYCSECNKEAFYAELDSRAFWYKQCSLCLECANAWGDDPNDTCSAYDMPLKMVKRKKKCVHFKPLKTIERKKEVRRGRQ